MANVPIKTLKFPDLENTYTIPQNLDELEGSISIEQGGTGADNPEGARINLGLNYTIISVF